MSSGLGVGNPAGKLKTPRDFEITHARGFPSTSILPLPIYALRLLLGLFSFSSIIIIQDSETARRVHLQTSDFAQNFLASLPPAREIPSAFASRWVVALYGPQPSADLRPPFTGNPSALQDLAPEPAEDSQNVPPAASHAAPQTLPPILVPPTPPTMAATMRAIIANWMPDGYWLCFLAVITILTVALFARWFCRREERSQVDIAQEPPVLIVQPTGQELLGRVLAGEGDREADILKTPHRHRDPHTSRLRPRASPAEYFACAVGAIHGESSAAASRRPRYDYLVKAARGLDALAAGWSAFTLAERVEVVLRLISQAREPCGRSSSSTRLSRALKGIRRVLDVWECLHDEQQAEVIRFLHQGTVFREAAIGAMLTMSAGIVASPRGDNLPSHCYSAAILHDSPHLQAGDVLEAAQHLHGVDASIEHGSPRTVVAEEPRTPQQDETAIAGRPASAIVAMPGVKETQAGRVPARHVTPDAGVVADRAPRRVVHAIPPPQQPIAPPRGPWESALRQTGCPDLGRCSSPSAAPDLVHTWSSIHLCGRLDNLGAYWRRRRGRTDASIARRVQQLGRMSRRSGLSEPERAGVDPDFLLLSNFFALYITTTCTHPPVFLPSLVYTLL
ncbi:hypothetical protein FB45DRAFT_1097098 [Roridomyces roridus]|uniref:Transmembrane protein n=1 Tax=Roridomyces roridus TaxID=1738132 RepID=A0AAD7BEH2_9AGAR|nr:hypothetical protein FB45DRAFT_1097098 [Roridomyces roridus]